MRLLLFFDLPMDSKSERRKYNKFRKWLIENGYIMMQYSIYCKIFNNRDACEQHMNIIQRNAPNEGSIRIMMVTENQYANIKIIVGGKTKQELVSNTDTFIEL